MNDEALSEASPTHGLNETCQFSLGFPAGEAVKVQGGLMGAPQPNRTPFADRRGWVFFLLGHLLTAWKVLVEPVGLSRWGRIFAMRLSPLGRIPPALLILPSVQYLLKVHRNSLLRDELTLKAASLPGHNRYAPDSPRFQRLSPQPRNRREA